MSLLSLVMQVCHTLYLFDYAPALTVEGAAHPLPPSQDRHEVSLLSFA